MYLFVLTQLTFSYPFLPSQLTAQCFPDDGTHHNVCCVDIDIPTDKSDLTALERLIMMASKPHSFSWCVFTNKCAPSFLDMSSTRC